MLKNKLIFKNIYNKIITLLDYSISTNYKEKKNNIKGINCLMEEYDFCHNKFTDNNYILLLKWGHIVHKNNKCCNIINNILKYCRICYIIKEKESIGSIQSNKYDELNLIDNYIQNDKKKAIDNEDNEGKRVY